jgi:hypothetical protein
LNKVMAALGIVAGGLATIFSLLDAFGVALTSGQQNAIGGVAGLILLVLGVWFHPDIAVGAKK